MLPPWGASPFRFIIFILEKLERIVNGILGTSYKIMTGKGGFFGREKLHFDEIMI